MSYIGNTVQNQNYVPAIDYFNGDGSTVAFTLSRPVASVAAVQAVISNVPQNPGSAFTVSGSTITFTSAPPSGTANIYVYYTSPNTQVVQPGQGTVGSTQMASGVNFTAGTITFADSSTISSHAAPQVTVYTSGSGTYTVPTGAKYLVVEMCAGGGGGGGSGYAATAGTSSSGSNSTFGTALLTCNGGGNCVPAGGASLGGVGGSATIGSGASGIALTGGNGQGLGGPVSNGQGWFGGIGGTNPFGGAGSSNYNSSVDGTANTGCGGVGGFAGNNSAYSGNGGGAGGYIKAVVTPLAASYGYSVGGGGAGGSAGTSGLAGGAGGSGVIMVTAYF